MFTRVAAALQRVGELRQQRPGPARRCRGRGAATGVCSGVRSACPRRPPRPASAVPARPGGQDRATAATQRRPGPASPTRAGPCAASRPGGGRRGHGHAGARRRTPRRATSAPAAASRCRTSCPCSRAAPTRSPRARRSTPAMPRTLNRTSPGSDCAEGQFGLVSVIFDEHPAVGADDDVVHQAELEDVDRDLGVEDRLDHLDDARLQLERGQRVRHDLRDLAGRPAGSAGARSGPRRRTPRSRRRPARIARPGRRQGRVS